MDDELARVLRSHARAIEDKNDELDTARARIAELTGALEDARDAHITDFGDAKGLRRCELCHHVQTGHGPFIHATKLSPEALESMPSLLPACLRIERALARVSTGYAANAPPQTEEREGEPVSDHEQLIRAVRLLGDVWTAGPRYRWDGDLTNRIRKFLDEFPAFLTPPPPSTPIAGEVGKAFAPGRECPNNPGRQCVDFDVEPHTYRCAYACAIDNSRGDRIRAALDGTPR